jgi:hypothetical protein
MSKALRFIAPVTIAVVPGPLIAGLAVSLFAVVLALFSSLGQTNASTLGLFPLYIIIAYAVGAPIAVLSGFILSIWMPARAPILIVVIAAAVVAIGINIGIGGLGLLGPVEFTNARSNFAFTLIAAVVAAAGCWPPTRRFARTA